MLVNKSNGEPKKLSLQGKILFKVYPGLDCSDLLVTWRQADKKIQPKDTQKQYGHTALNFR